MNLSLTFVEYDAINSIRSLRPVSFNLLSTAKLGTVGSSRAWVLSGNADAFETLSADVKSAMQRFVRVSVSHALTDITTAIGEMIKADAHDGAALAAGAQGLDLSLLPPHNTSPA